MKEFWIGSSEPREQETAGELKTFKIEKPDDTNFTLGQTHFIKSVEDNLGDDADTTGAICGQLAEAYWVTLEFPNCCGQVWYEGK